MKIQLRRNLYSSLGIGLITFPIKTTILYLVWIKDLHIAAMPKQGATNRKPLLNEKCLPDTWLNLHTRARLNILGKQSNDGFSMTWPFNLVN